MFSHFAVNSVLEVNCVFAVNSVLEVNSVFAINSVLEVNSVFGLSSVFMVEKILVGTLPHQQNITACEKCSMVPLPRHQTL